MSETDKNRLSELEGKGLHIPPPGSGPDPVRNLTPGSGSDPVRNLPPSDEIYTGQEYRTSSSKSVEKPASIGKDILILVMITLVAGVLLGAAYTVTKGPVARAQEAATAKAQSEVMSSAQSFDTLYASGQDGEEEIPASLPDALEDAGIGTTEVKQIDAALDKDQKVIGYVITASDPDGYGGDVELMCGIIPGDDGSVTIEGISFLSLSETAGMGMRAKEDSFMDQFSKKTVPKGELIVYSKNGAVEENEIDAISGCTITTSSVTDDVNAAMIAALHLMENRQEETE